MTKYLILYSMAIQYCKYKSYYLVNVRFTVEIDKFQLDRAKR